MNDMNELIIKFQGPPGVGKALAAELCVKALRASKKFKKVTVMHEIPNSPEMGYYGKFQSLIKTMPK